MSKEDIAAEFDQYGVEVDDALLEKCVELCVEYGVQNATDFVDEWMAYTTSYLQGAEPTLETITTMARNELDASKKAAAAAAKAKHDEPSVRIYGGSQGQDIDDDIMDSYIEPTSPKRKIAKPIHHTPHHVFSPASYSPISVQERKTNEQAGNAVVTFGQSQLLKQCQWTAHRDATTLPIVPSKMFKNLPDNELYMTDMVSVQAMLTGDKVYTLSELILKHLKSQKIDAETEDDILELQHCNVACLDKIVCAGLIVMEGNTPDKHSVYLVGLDETTLRKVRLDFSKCKRYSVFPGQVVLVEGYNSRGDTFVVDQIHASTSILSCPRIAIRKPISMIVCSGPYTSADALTYLPLEDLVNYCNQHAPDLLIMTGAILSEKINEKTLRDVAERYDRHFEKFLQKLAGSLPVKTQILLVSSHEDVNGASVYPTFKYRSQKQFPNLHLLPDPCVVDVDGLHIGITSTDVLTELSEREVSHNDGIDKVKRAVHYVFHQKSFYPLRPPKEVPLDTGLASKHAKLDTLPHIMIMPSSLKEFIRDYNSCLCVNPGKLFGGATESGKFARIVMHPPENEAQKLYNFVAGQVLKI